MNFLHKQLIAILLLSICAPSAVGLEMSTGEKLHHVPGWISIGICISIILPIFKIKHRLDDAYNVWMTPHNLQASWNRFLESHKMFDPEKTSHLLVQLNLLQASINTVPEFPRTMEELNRLFRDGKETHSWGLYLSAVEDAKLQFPILMA